VNSGGGGMFIAQNVSFTGVGAVDVGNDPVGDDTVGMDANVVDVETGVGIGVPDVAVVGIEVVDVAGVAESAAIGIAPITSSSRGPLKLSTTLLCSPRTSLPMMISEHKSLITSATTFVCWTPLIVMSTITSPVILATCFLLARGIVRCFGNMINLSLLEVDSLMKVPELPVSIIALVVLPSTLHFVYDTFLLPSQANEGGR
jgi:hypothetical protein